MGIVIPGWLLVGCTNFHRGLAVEIHNFQEFNCRFTIAVDQGGSTVKFGVKRLTESLGQRLPSRDFPKSTEFYFAKNIVIDQDASKRHLLTLDLFPNRRGKL